MKVKHENIVPTIALNQVIKYRSNRKTIILTVSFADVLFMVFQSVRRGKISAVIDGDERRRKKATQRVCLKLDYKGRLIKASAEDYK
jgi:hypothetical protein